mmetsp:Transcript_6834/g.10028  ORF Transcript_6834/g.10028 Transcript_6834/m.10028 type:complete len:178 (+) Transcript_6834:414-947(+)|eukprot:CAMPEP_0196813190 /NCGR_PEP_ID=MMETSP1362-20130617/34557_1 /TAXON_ID=163516 /ORGANISM="Leptocylindrus danicus, Strain CCMP1856" /LENGTH=177 /DNA_ID=CAMNT_0042189267 /DNA_START=215 /DNA_END=748 /DNA_ORIENTATION=-
MTPEQINIRKKILASRTTGLSGPFGPWLAVPSIADPAQTLGKACRYDTSLTPRESELVILLTAAYYRSPTEFEIHRNEALKAGLTEDIINAFPRGDEFSLSNVKTRVVPLLGENERELAVALFAAEVLATKQVCDSLYQSTLETFGGKHEVLVEVTSIIGYYAYVAYTLNVFCIPAK